MKEEKKTEAWEENLQPDMMHKDPFGINDIEYFEKRTVISLIKSEKEASYKDGRKEGVNEVLVEVEKMIKKVDEDGVDPFDYVAGAEISAYKKVLSILNKYKI